jgi:response regulator NasT
VESLILAFANESTCRNVHSLLESSGIPVRTACTSGAKVLREAAKFDKGIVVSGFKLLDMTANDLSVMLPDGYVMLMLATQLQQNLCTNHDVIFLTTPVNKNELITSVLTIQHMQRITSVKQKLRRIADKNAMDISIVERAKGMLMVRHNISEEDAHRMLQKQSMNSGSKMVDTARKILFERDGVL